MMPKKSAIRGTPSGDLKKCPECESYTLKDNCPKCNDQKIKTESISYKFPKIRDAPPAKNFKRR